MAKRFKVISLHYTSKCNLKCPFCYAYKGKDVKPAKFWLGLIPYMTKLTNQVALGGGEPFINVPFIKKFAKECKKHNLICNVTTNGRLLMKMTDKQLKAALKDITMVSISYDTYKIKTERDMMNYIGLVKRIKALTGCQVGANLLVTEGKILHSVPFLFAAAGVHRVYALFPKNMPAPDILKYKLIYMYYSEKYEHFYVDDTTKMVLESGSYTNWKTPCHYFQDVISINQIGEVSGCSFEKTPLLVLDNPKDLLKIAKIKLEKRYDCPYIKR